MRRLAARCRTCVQHQRRGVHAVAQQQAGGALRRRGLDGRMAVGKAGNVRHRLWPLQTHGGAAERAGADTVRCQARAEIRHGGALQIDAQIHRRRLLGRRQYGGPVRRMIALQAFDPPRRMVPARHRVLRHGLHQRSPLAQKSAQAGVDEGRLWPQRWTPFGRFHRLIDQREHLVGRLRLGLRQRQAGAQKCIGRRGRRAARQLPAQGLGQTEPAQRVKRQRLRTWAQGRLHTTQLC